MTHTSRAWVMDLGAGWQVAASAAQVVEYMLEPEVVGIPRTPGHCAGLMVWRDRMIPVIDFAPLQPAGSVMAEQRQRVAILAYQDAPGQPLRYGALLVTAAPIEFWASDDMAGSLKDVPAVFSQVARSCFVRNDRTIPVLDARRLFARPLSGLPEAINDEREARPAQARPFDASPEPDLSLESPMAAPDNTGPGSMDDGVMEENRQAWRLFLAEQQSPGLLEARAGTSAPDDAGVPENMPPDVAEENVRMWQAYIAEDQPAVAAPESIEIQIDAPATDEAAAQEYAEVISSAASAPVDALTDVPVYTEPGAADVAMIDFADDVLVQGDEPMEQEILVARAVEPQMDAAEPDVLVDPAGDTGEAMSVTGAVIGGAVPPKLSDGTLQSFQRLHGIARETENRKHRADQRTMHWLFGVAALAATVLAILASVQLVLVGFSGPGSTSSDQPVAQAKQPVAHDVAPGGVDPALVPSTPVQPPR